MKKFIASLSLVLCAFTAQAYQMWTPAGTVDVVVSNIEGTKRTYTAVIADFVPAATATDVATLVGATGKIVTLTQIRISASASTSTFANFYLFKRTALDTAGTAVQTPITKHDSMDISPSAVVNQYSVNPTSLGAGSMLRSEHVSFSAAAAGNFVMVWDFADRAAKSPKLRSAIENFAINFNGAAVPAGSNIHITMEWTEE